MRCFLFSLRKWARQMNRRRQKKLCEIKIFSSRASRVAWIFLFPFSTAIFFSLFPCLLSPAAAAKPCLKWKWKTWWTHLISSKKNKQKSPWTKSNILRKFVFCGAGFVGGIHRKLSTRTVFKKEKENKIKVETLEKKVSGCKNVEDEIFDQVINFLSLGINLRRKSQLRVDKRDLFCGVDGKSFTTESLKLSRRCFWIRPSIQHFFSLF